jgi:acyl-coenzyme A thioesterase PaaI-like protein
MTRSAPPTTNTVTASPARLAAAAKLRQLNAAFVGHEAADRDLTELVATLERATDRLQAGSPRRRSFAEIADEAAAPEVADSAPAEHFDVCFVTGPASPVGLAGTVHREGDSLVYRTRIPRTFEGMPGFAHGGIVAAIFDDIIGMVMGRLHRTSAPTVRVETSFHTPIPLEEEIEIRASLVDRDGRKCRVHATATSRPPAARTLYAEADGLLIVLRDNQLAEGFGGSTPTATEDGE